MTPLQFILWFILGAVPIGIIFFIALSILGLYRAASKYDREMETRMRGGLDADKN